MVTSGNANYGMQARQAAEQGAGDPRQRPSGSDKRVIVLSLVAIAAIGVAMAIFT